MTAAKCPKCGRPTALPDRKPVREHCHERGGHECNIAAAAYRRGLRDGVALAKGRVVVRDELDDLAELDWSDADRELEDRCR